MAKQRLNVKLLAWTALTMAALGSGIHILHGDQAECHFHDLRDQADRAEKAGRLDQAAVYWNRSLVFAPDDPDTLARYALLLDRLAGTPAARVHALSVLEQAVALDPSRHDVRRRLAVRALNLNLPGRARPHLEHLLAAWPRDPELQELLGQCLEATGALESARAAYEKAIRLAPTRTDSYVRLALLLQGRLGKPAAAGQVVDRLVKANPQSAAALLIRADYHRAHGSAVQAASDIARARRLAPDDAEVLWASATLAQFEGRLEEARQTWQRARDLYAGDVRMVLGLAGLEIEAGRRPAAAMCLRQGLRKLPDQPDLLHTLADLLLQGSQGEEAGRLIGRLHPDRSPAALAGYLHGRLLLYQRRWAEAAQALEEAAEDGDASVALASRASLYLAQCYERLGDADRRLTALGNAVRRDPTGIFARVQLADALLEAGRLEPALEQYRAVVKQPQAPAAAWLRLARALVMANLRLPASKRDWREVETALARAERSVPQAAAVAVLRADVLLAQDRAREAQALLEQARDRRPTEVVLWTALANLALRRGWPEAAAKTLKKARRRLGDRAELWMAQVDLVVQQGARQAAQLLREQENALSRFPPGDQARLLRHLVLAHSRLGDPAQAARLAWQAARRDATDLPARLLLLEVTLQTGRDEAIAEAVREVRRLEGEAGAWWRYGEAARLVVRSRGGDRAARAQARRLFQELAARRANWTRPVLLEATLDEQEGNNDRALAGYLKAVELGESQPAGVVHIAQLLAEHGRHLEADRVMEKYQEQALPGREQARFGADIALRAGRPDRARELARLAVPIQSRDYREHLWLGGVLEAAGRRAQAEEVLRRAVELADRVPDAWVALVAHLARAGEADRGEEAIAAMSGRLAPAQLPLALAQCREALGQLSAAEAQFEAALARRPDDFVVLRRAAAYYVRTDQLTHAVPILRRLLDPVVEAPDESLSWGRRNLALVLAGSGDRSGYRQALALLQQTRAPAGESVADRRARALVQATRADQRPKTLQTLDRLLHREPLTADERYRLALVYETAGERFKAQALLRRLTEEDVYNPAYLTAYGRSLVRTGQVEEVPAVLARLTKLEPASARTKGLQAMARRAGIVHPKAGR
jgi:tetratricopeptide (TPR) repeat protein